MLKILEPKYFIFQLLWLLLMVPTQQMQFLVLVGISGCIFLSSNRKILLDKVTVYFVIWTLIYIVSIFVNSIFTEMIPWTSAISDLSKAGTWVLAVYLYQYYKTVYLDRHRISYLILFNIFVMFLIVLFYAFNSTGNIMFWGRRLLSWDGITGSYSHRYTGFLEYSTLNGQLLMFLFPMVVLLSLKNRYKIIILSFMLAVLCLSLSRIATISFFIAYLGYIFNIQYQKNRSLLAALRIILLFALIFMGKEFYNLLGNLFYLRSNSTQTRMIVYSESIQKALESPLWGRGIRLRSTVGIYLGSHSAYISFIYRTGILGISLVSVAYFNLFKSWIRENRNQIWRLFYIISLLIFMCFEEVDPHHWSTVLFFVGAGLLSRNEPFDHTYSLNRCRLD